MGKGIATFTDRMKQRCSITTLEAESLSVMTAYANAIEKYSDGVLAEISFVQSGTITPKNVAATSNVDRKGIVICRDAKKRIHKATIPSLKAGQTKDTPEGERLTEAVIDGVATALSALVGVKCDALYGYPIQKK